MEVAMQQEENVFKDKIANGSMYALKTQLSIE